MPDDRSATDALAPEIRALRDEFRQFNSHRFVRIHNSTLRLMWYQFLRGLAFGLGTVIGASALVSGLVLVLSQIEFVPIIGEFATEIIREIQADRPE